MGYRMISPADAQAQANGQHLVVVPPAHLTTSAPADVPVKPLFVGMVYNDGGFSENSEVFTAEVSTVGDILYAADCQMGRLPICAARVFTTTGAELVGLIGAPQGVCLVISSGEDFRPRGQQRMSVVDPHRLSGYASPSTPPLGSPPKSR